MITQQDLDYFIKVCLAKGWRVRVHNHLKTKANWDKLPKPQHG